MSEANVVRSPQPGGLLSPRSVRSWRSPLTLVALAVAVSIAGLALGVRRSPQVQSFAVVFLGIVLEALPFIVLGSLVSAALETVAPERVSAAIARVPTVLAIPVAGLLGMIFPVCDCGAVPVARRLARRGLAPQAAVAFMLAAPIVNPVVIFATAIALRGRFALVLGRVGLAYAVALLAAWAVKPQAAAMFAGSLEQAHQETHEHEHDHEESSFSEVLAHDVVFMGRYLMLGAALAATITTLVPRSLLDGVTRVPLLAVLGLMLLAVVMSVCAQADAFVAASFTAFPPAALLAFLVFGPMIDLKTIAMYTGAFGGASTRRLVIAVAAPVVAGALWLQVMLR